MWDLAEVGEGGKREEEKAKREAERGGGQPDEGGGLYCTRTVRNRQLLFCVPAADDRRCENFSFRLVLTPPCKQRAGKLSLIRLL